MLFCTICVLPTLFSVWPVWKWHGTVLRIIALPQLKIHKNSPRISTLNSSCVGWRHPKKIWKKYQLINFINNYQKSNFPSNYVMNILCLVKWKSMKSQWYLIKLDYNSVYYVLNYAHARTFFVCACALNLCINKL